MAFGWIRWLITGRTQRRATTLVSVALIPMLAATAFVGWAESAGGASFRRAVTWWAPIIAVAVLAGDFGPVGPVLYAYMLFLLPVLNGRWPLWDRRARLSLNDRAANTIVVRERGS